MIPDRIVHYLQTNVIPFTRHWHARAFSAQELAQSLHVSGKRVAKTVVIDADGTVYLCVIPGNTRLDLQKVALALDAQQVQLVPEEQFRRLFPDCDVGAEPPFGRLYHLPVLLDTAFDPEERIIVRAGSHEETLELSFRDFLRIEHPEQLSLSSPPEPVLDRVLEPEPPTMQV